MTAELGLEEEPQARDMAEPWMDDAACTQVDPELFFPGKGESLAPAKSVCKGCSVTAECLAYALRTDQRYGVWAGLSERELRRLGAAS